MSMILEVYLTWYANYRPLPPRTEITEDRDDVYDPVEDLTSEQFCFSDGCTSLPLCYELAFWMAVEYGYNHSSHTVTPILSGVHSIAHTRQWARLSCHIDAFDLSTTYISALPNFSGTAQISINPYTIVYGDGITTKDGVHHLQYGSFPTILGLYGPMAEINEQLDTIGTMDQQYTLKKYSCERLRNTLAYIAKHWNTLRCLMTYIPWDSVRDMSDVLGSLLPSGLSELHIYNFGQKRMSSPEKGIPTTHDTKKKDSHNGLRTLRCVFNSIPYVDYNEDLTDPATAGGSPLQSQKMPFLADASFINIPTTKTLFSLVEDLHDHPSLTTLRLETRKCLGSSPPHDTTSILGCLDSVRHLEIGTVPLLWVHGNVPQTMSNLQHLTVTITADDAASVLPHIPSLTILIVRIKMERQQQRPSEINVNLWKDNPQLRQISVAPTKKPDPSAENIIWEFCPFPSQLTHVSLQLLYGRVQAHSFFDAFQPCTSSLRVVDLSPIMERTDNIFVPQEDMRNMPVPCCENVERLALSPGSSGVARCLFHRRRRRDDNATCLNILPAMFPNVYKLIVRSPTDVVRSVIDHYRQYFASPESLHAFGWYITKYENLQFVCPTLRKDPRDPLFDDMSNGVRKQDIVDGNISLLPV